MFEYINGILEYKSIEYIVIDINGIGYLVKVPYTTYEKLPEEGNKVKIYIYTAIRENDITFYGFYEKIEKEAFQTIISISNIGPKIGIAILSMYSLNELMDIIKNEDQKRIEAVSGIGKSKSLIILASLKTKFSKLIEKMNLYDISTDKVITTSYTSIKDDIKQGLESLGFTNIKLEKYIKDEEIEEFNDVSKVMKEVLKRINKK